MIEVELLEIDPTWLLARKKGGEPFKLEVLTLSEKTQGMLDELAYSEEWLTKRYAGRGECAVGERCAYGVGEVQGRDAEV
ncbi:MAG: hypothetical protein O3A92_08900 [Verrucomicrobia bacterium]|nr:hypothetical protein [Verrucomicrobiota bacterium]